MVRAGDMLYIDSGEGRCRKARVSPDGTRRYTASVSYMPHFVPDESELDFNSDGTFFFRDASACFDSAKPAASAHAFASLSDATTRQPRHRAANSAIIQEAPQPTSRALVAPLPATLAAQAT